MSIEFNGIKLLNFNDLLRKIEIELLNDLENFGLINDFKVNLKHPDVKNLIFHHLIFGICEELKNKSKEKNNVLIVPPEISPDHEIGKFCELEKFYKLTLKFVQRIKNNIPFVIHATKDLLDDILSDDGKRSEMISLIYDLRDKKRNSSYSLETIKDISDRFNLTYLSEQYFNDVKNKAMLYK